MPPNAVREPPTPSATSTVRACFVAPRHRADPQWMWITHLPPLRRFDFERIYIDNTYEPAPKLTAGSEGAEVLAMQFGQPSERPGSDPSKLASRDPNGYVERKNA